MRPSLRKAIHKATTSSEVRRVTWAVGSPALGMRLRPPDATAREIARQSHNGTI